MDELMNGYVSAREQMMFQREMSNSAHQREVADLKAAGLNPVLSAHGSGASTPTGASDDLSGILTALNASIANTGKALSNKGLNPAKEEKPVSFESWSDPSKTYDSYDDAADHFYDLRLKDKLLVMGDKFSDMNGKTLGIPNELIGMYLTNLGNYIPYRDDFSEWSKDQLKKTADSYSRDLGAGSARSAWNRIKDYVNDEIDEMVQSNKATYGPLLDKVSKYISFQNPYKK